MQDQTFVLSRTGFRYTERLNRIARAQDELRASSGLPFADRQRIRMVERSELPESPGGFFYGHQYQDESATEYRERDLEFCQWARAVLQTRQKVFYSCWW